MMGQRDMLDNRQSQADTMPCAFSLMRPTVEPFKNAVLLGFRNTTATIDDADRGIIAIIGTFH